MKRTLLLLPLLCGAAASFAQTPLRTTVAGPWAGVNTSNVATAPNYAIGRIVTLSPTFAWGLAGNTNGGPNYPWNTSVRATNAAGTEFDFNPVVGTPGFQPTNISVPMGVSGNTTAFCGQYATGATVGGGGEVIRSTDGGVSWQIITTSAQFPPANSFCNWVHAFDANHGIFGGDPLPNGSGLGTFEFWYTNNASTANPAAVTWTRAVTPAPLDADELALINSYTAVGNTIWAGTMHYTNGVPGPARVLRSTNQGHSWTAANTPIVGQIMQLAFKDQLNGIGFARPDALAQSQLIVTSDGGLTWTLQPVPNPLSADTLFGRFYHYGIAALPNQGFLSYGSDGRRFGASISGSGRLFPGGSSSWRDIDTGTNVYYSASFVGLVVQSFNCYRGYLGGVTSNGSNGPSGSGGLYQANSCALIGGVGLATKSATPHPALLTAAPNPSPDGQFQLHFIEAIQPGTHFTVFDALGRLVLARTLTATATGSATAPLDLRHQPAGIYSLRLTTGAGTTIQKLVIE